MADDDDEEAPAIELGEGPDVAGAPVARVASRLSWPRSKSDVIVQEGETTIRSGEGPQVLEDVLEEIETPYFATRQEFVHDIREVIGDNPVDTYEFRPMLFTVHPPVASNESPNRYGSRHVCGSG